MPSKTQSNNLGKVLCYGAILQISHLLFDRNQINRRAHVRFCLRLLFLRSSEKDFSNHSCFSWVSEKMCGQKPEISIYELPSWSAHRHSLLMYMSRLVLSNWCLHEASEASRELWNNTFVFWSFIHSYSFSKFTLASVTLNKLRFAISESK